MRNVLIGSSMLLASVAAATAADLPVRSAAPAPVMMAPLPYNWSGFYVGLNAGAAWSSGCTNYTLLTSGVVANNWPSTCEDNNSAQFTGGAQIGYNFQAGNFVYGIEADINGVGNSNNGTRTAVFGSNATPPNGVYRVTGLGDPGVFGTVRARLGFAADRALFYVTGGLAWANGSDDPAISYWASTTNPPVGDANVTWRRGGASGIGWTLGAGLEYAIANNWTIRGEYLYVDLGKEDNAWRCTAGSGYSCANLDFTGRADVNFSVVRVGVNYKFGGARSNAPVLARY